ncbi:MAG: NUDIX domain-containing protein [Verrucomicrobia bacterium]|nr:NUDIX domain-containing protein [Verrucomicrobiota bacterium]
MNQQRFLFCSRCGGAKVRRRSPVEFECEACGFKHFTNPTVAVAAIIANRAGEILLIRRAKDPGRGKLSVPGGFVDPGETGEEAVRREVFEEVNLQVKAFQYLASFPNQYQFQDVIYPTLDVFFTAETETFAEARAKVEVQSVIGVAPASVEFGEVAFPSVEKALRLYLVRLHRG